MQINAMIFFDDPFRGWHVIPLLGVVQTTSLLVVLITHQQRKARLSTAGVAHLLAVDGLVWVCYKFFLSIAS